MKLIQLEQHEISLAPKIQIKMAQEEDDRFNYNIFDMLKKLEDEEDEESEERGNESLRNLINPKRKHEVAKGGIT